MIDMKSRKTSQYKNISFNYICNWKYFKGLETLWSLPYDNFDCGKLSSFKKLLMPTIKLIFNSGFYNVELNK